MAGDGDFRRLGPYVLLRTSGAGGMGRIDLALRAQSGGIPKLCVLKRMHAELRSPDQEARFRREASIALQLSHDGIAQTVGVEEIDGELVLLQELVHGVDLRLLETRMSSSGERVPIAVAVHVVSEVARALEYAHAFADLGIVHRDVTPDNVMLAFSGEVKLVDFGIARSDVDATLTATGHVVGRPTYTAPEVWEGAQADRRADIYSLGIVLWQLLTGRRLEDARVRVDRLTPSPSTLNVEVPAQLDGVVSRALEADPARRHQTAGELQEALRPFLPDGFQPQAALGALLARHFDVARERHMLAADVERAMHFLGSTEPEPAPTAKALEPARPLASGATAPRRTHRSLGAMTAIGVAVLALVLLLRVGLRPSPSSPPNLPAEPPIAATPPTLPATLPAPKAAAVQPAPEVIREPAQAPIDPPPRAHPAAASARHARLPGAKVVRPVSAPAPDDLLNRAQEKFDVGDTGAARALARQAANAGAGSPAHVLMGKVLMSERRFDEAEQEFAEAVRLDPGDARAARLLALVRETRRSGP